MKKLLIIGAGGLGRMTLETALSLGYKCSFLDDDETLKEVCGSCVIGKIELLKNFLNDYEFCICAIGDNKLREKITNLAQSLGFCIPNIISPTAYISPFAKIGIGAIILNNVCIQNGSFLGDGVVINANSEIHHDSEIGDFSLIYSCSSIRTFSKIGRRAKIGSTVTISNNAVVLDDAIVEDGDVIK